MRHQVYAHVEKYLIPKSRILELNAGTGIDALFFIWAGHQVHATDLADGMISQIKAKISKHGLANQLTCHYTWQMLDPFHPVIFYNPDFF